MFLKSNNLAAMPSVSHGFFTRGGGVSSGIYTSLNCGVGTRDAMENVLENRARVARALGAGSGNILTLCQVHSADVVTVRERWDIASRPQADAMVTNLPGLALGIMTADCVPVLFADAQKSVVGAAHSGWKGAFADISRNTLEAMIALGAERKNIVAAIGPAIAQRSYEVDEAFRRNFVHTAQGNSRYFVPSARAGRWLFDLKRYVYDSIADCGVENINILENDTYMEEDAFFSFRRATHRGEPDYGRQISAIMLNS